MHISNIFLLILPLILVCQGGEYVFQHKYCINIKMLCHILTVKQICQWEIHQFKSPSELPNQQMHHIIQQQNPMFLVSFFLLVAFFLFPFLMVGDFVSDYGLSSKFGMLWQSHFLFGPSSPLSWVSQPK